MTDPYSIIIKPHITEKTVRLSYGDSSIRDEDELQRKYTFIVAPKANKIEIKKAFEAIYNREAKKGEELSVESVRTITVRGKMRRVGQRAKGKRPDFKKAVITLAKGQVLEDYGV